MTVSDFTITGLTEAQWRQIEALAISLDQRQRIWVSGFFAGLEHRARENTALADLPPKETSDALALPEAGTRTVTVLYGSETGNSAALAADFAERAADRGCAVTVCDMADYKLRHLKDEQDLILIASTYGEGDPPQPAAGFFEFLEGRKVPKLPGLRFAVLALGDSTYEYFCQAGKRLDRRLEELGARRLRARVDCDVDYDDAALAWIDGVLADLVTTRSNTPNPAKVAPAPKAEGVDKRHPFLARIIENIGLTGRGSSKETRHVELSLEGAAMAFEPGDALGLLPQNDPRLVDDLLSTLDLQPSSAIQVKDRPTSLGDALRTDFEITSLTPRFLGLWADLANSAVLKRLALPDNAEERASFLHQHHVVDVVRQFPVPGLDAGTFVSGLRPLQPRLYSIASSRAAAPDEAHLTISTLRYDIGGEPRSGVASGHVAERCDPDGFLPVYVQANPHFRLPADDVPIIMIGAGTGVAPYRAFMQEREARGASGRSWLLFGDRNFRTDFLYQTEWQALLKEGTLTRMDVAFSRDGGSGGKTYVQHRLAERGRDIFAWLEEGAHLYVCGDASRLAPDVHLALAALVAAGGGLGPDATEDYLRRLQEERRYQRDVY